MTHEELFIVSRWAYSIGKPIIPDDEYNNLLRMFQKTKPDWEYVTRSWSSDPCPVELLKQVGREDLIKAIVLSDKTESIPSLNSWAEVNTFYGNMTPGKNYTISYKHDGWNVQATYYKGQLIDVSTRGRSTDAMDVSGLMEKLPKAIPVTQDRVKVIMECTCSFKLFDEMKVKFNNANPRSAVSTALAKPDYLTRLSLHAFDIIGEPVDNIFSTLMAWGFDVPMWDTVTNYEELIDAIKRFSVAFGEYNSPTDGLVVAEGANRRAIRVGPWEEPTYHSYVVGYEQSYGPHNISLKLKIRPVKTSKGTQNKLAITNVARIIQNDLQIGSPVAFNIVSAANADFNEKVTAMLQKEWEGNYEGYKAYIEREVHFNDRMDEH